jgi:acyl-[acyl-carrier-protein]-phospholipid O-acyltransferase/long-chain-fatty-acid--[acyl-carrier-protein] ligase
VRSPLFFERRFFPLWAAFSTSAFNDNVLRQALIIGIGYGMIPFAGFDDPKNAIPLFGGLFSAATLACTSIAGQVAEKYETAMLLRRLKVAELLLMTLAAIGFFLDSGVMLAAIFVLMSAQLAFFSPVRITALPKYLRADELIRGNAYCNAGMFISVVLGILIGGVLIPLDKGWMAVSAILAVAATASWLGVLAQPPSPPEAPDLRIDWNPIGQTIRMMGFAFAEPGVWRPLVGVAFFYVVSTITTVLVPLYAIEELGANGAAATAIMGVFAIGCGFGAIISATLSKRRSGLGFSCIGIAGAGAITFGLYWLTDVVAATGASATMRELMTHTPGRLLLAGFFLSSACTGLYLVPLQAAAQRRAPKGKRARVLAAGNLLNAACAMSGSLCVLVITATPMKPATGFLVISVLELGLAAYMALRWLALPSGQFDDSLIEGAVEKAPVSQGANPV